MPPMEHFSNPSEDLTTMWCEYKKTYKTALSKSTSTAQQHGGYLIDYHQSQVKQESSKMKTSTTMANHDPRMDRTNPTICALLGIVGTWSTSCDFCISLLLSLCVLDMVCSCPVCSLSGCCYFVFVLVFGISALKPLWHVKPQLRNLSKLCFPLVYLCHLVKHRSFISKTLTLTLLVVDHNSSRDTYPRSDATIFATCLRLRQDLSPATRKPKTDPPELKRASRRQRLH
jgi:hypothetical protein